MAVVGRKFQETYDQLEGDKAIESTRAQLPAAALNPEFSDPQPLPFQNLATSVQTLESDDTEFYLNLKNLQRMIDQCVAADEITQTVSV